MSRKESLWIGDGPREAMAAREVAAGMLLA